MSDVAFRPSPAGDGRTGGPLEQGRGWRQIACAPQCPRRAITELASAAVVLAFNSLATLAPPLLDWRDN